MAIANFRCLVLAMLMATVILISGNHQVSAQCQASIPSLASQCLSSVQRFGRKIPPSAECCAVVKGVDIPCVCKLVTGIVEFIISMEKVVYVGRSCGLTIQPGTICGSYTVPPS